MRAALVALVGHGGLPAAAAVSLGLAWVHGAENGDAFLGLVFVVVAAVLLIMARFLAGAPKPKEVDLDD